MAPKQKSSVSSLLSTLAFLAKAFLLCFSLEHLLFEPLRNFESISPIPTLGLQISAASRKDMEDDYFIYAAYAILAWWSFTSILKHLWRRSDDIVQGIVVMLIFVVLWNLIMGGARWGWNSKGFEETVKEGAAKIQKRMVKKR